MPSRATRLSHSTGHHRFEGSRPSGNSSNPKGQEHRDAEHRKPGAQPRGDSPRGQIAGGGGRRVQGVALGQISRAFKPGDRAEQPAEGLGRMAGDDEGAERRTAQHDEGGPNEVDPKPDGIGGRSG